MFKSPAKPMPTKRAPINFVKTVTSPPQSRPLQVQTSKTINTLENDFTIDQFSKPSVTSLLSIQLTLDKPIRTLKLTFPFTAETAMQELMGFIQREVNQSFLYFKTKNLNIEYMLTLPLKKVKDLGLKKLQMIGAKLKVDKKGNYLSSLDIIKCLGTGGFSKVYLARGYGRLMAMKVINKHFIIQNQKQNIVQNQREILEKCNGHPFITQLYLSFQTKKYLIFCMEYCHGGELFNLLRKVRRMKQSEAKFYFVQTLAAISHLHSQQILYRDLKPENIIIDSEGHIRLADYGLSKIMKEERTHSFCGSAQYMAPEMLLKKGHSFQIDYYCLGALLYELLIGLPPYYSRNQNELFSNILNKELQFPPNVQLSKDLKKMLQRLLQKDTDLRFKKVNDIFAHPWLRDINLEDVLSKKLDPPFKTNMFQNNFDNSDFVSDQQAEILKLQKQKDRGRLQPEQVCFPSFLFVDQQLSKIESQCEEQRLDFHKKPVQPAREHTRVQKQMLWRNGSMKSIDNSQLFMENQHQYSPRMMAQPINRSNDKLKMFVSQNSNFSSNPSYLTNPKTSQIINISRGSQLSNNSTSKLLGSHNVPFAQKSQLLPRNNQRFASPININNYINIYTHKSPNSHQTNYNPNNPNNYVSPQPKKALSYGNASFEKSINGSIIKNHGVNGIATGSSSLQRIKFSSLEKQPILTSLNVTPNYPKPNNVYPHSQNTTPLNNRGYLSNFKERFNPNQKIKKSYKTNDKFSFNFFNATTPYKHS